MADIIDQINIRGFAWRDEWKYARDAWADRVWRHELRRIDSESGRREIRIRQRTAWRKLKIAVLREHCWIRNLIKG